MNGTLRAGACAALAALAATVGAGSAAAAGDVYVALGDSYTAAPLVPGQYGEPIACLRSDHNYASLVRAAIGAAAFRDESCSAATSDDIFAPQAVLGGTHAAQERALSRDASLVTIGIGGNDVGLVGAATTCLSLGLLAPTGTACRTRFATPNGGDALVDRIDATAAKIARTLRAIHDRSPSARVLLVGYPDVAPRDGIACYPLVPLSSDDIAYLDAMLRRTNAMLAEQAAANDAEYVDTYDDSVGHDVCTPPGTRWFEGLIPTALAYPLHPNALGEASMARSVLRVLGQPRPAPLLGTLVRARRTIASGQAASFRYTLSRAASVTFTLQRSLGRGRYAAARALSTVSAQRGTNIITLPARRIGTRPGLYRIGATPAGGATQITHVRIRRAR